MRGARAIRRGRGLPELAAFAADLRRVPLWQVIVSLVIPWVCLDSVIRRMRCVGNRAREISQYIVLPLP